MTNKKIKLLMVCLGNICRSPTAEIVVREKVLAENLASCIEIESAGTGSWHIGDPPDSRAVSAALSRDYDMTKLRARQVCVGDIETFDYIFAMDRQNLHDLRNMSSPQQLEKISLFLLHGSSDYDEVPDPYYVGGDGFELVLDLIEDAASNLVRTLAARHHLV